MTATPLTLARVTHSGERSAVPTRPGLHPATTALGLFVCTVMSLYAWFAVSPTAAVLSTVILQVLAAVWGYRARPFGLPLAFYSFTTFMFLTGRILVVGVLGYQRTSSQPWGLHEPTPEVAVQVLMLVQTFTAAIFLTSLVLAISLRGRGRAHRGSVLQTRPTATAVALGAMIVGAPLYLQNRLSFLGSVSSAGLGEFYLAQDDLLTPTGRLGGALLMVGFAFLLASLPRWSTFLCGTLVIVLCHGLNLVIGRRADFVLTLVLVVFYIVLRANIKVVDGRGRPVQWPGDHILALGSVAALPLMLLLDYIGRTRNLAGSTSDADDSPILGFFYDQGVTANILGFLVTDRFPLPQDKLYSFGPLIEFVQTRLMPGFDSKLYQTQSAERALEGHQFADAISYYAMGKSYLMGQGYGSSAVAELFWDFGPVGVVLGGVVIALLLAYISRAAAFPLVASAFLFLAFRDLLYTPRAPFLYWLVGSLNVYNLLVFVLLLAATWLAGAVVAASRSRRMV